MTYFRVYPPACFCLGVFAYCCRLRDLVLAFGKKSAEIPKQNTAMKTGGLRNNPGECHTENIHTVDSPITIFRHSGLFVPWRGGAQWFAFHAAWTSVSGSRVYFCVSDDAVDMCASCLFNYGPLGCSPFHSE